MMRFVWIVKFCKNFFSISHSGRLENRENNRNKIKNKNIRNKKKGEA